VLTDLDISPTSPDPGENVTISALVTNAGGLTGTYAVPLKINGMTEDTQEVTLAPGASQMVSFSVTTGDPGKYDIEVGPLTGEFEVDGAGTGSGWITPVIIVLGVVVAALAVVLLVRWAHRRPLSRG
jgi:hypothetical protein